MAAALRCTGYKLELTGHQNKTLRPMFVRQKILKGNNSQPDILNHFYVSLRHFSFTFLCCLKSEF